jgi:hypothetical protein
MFSMSDVTSSHITSLASACQYMHGGDFVLGSSSLIVSRLFDEWTMGREAQPPILKDEQVEQMLGHLQDASHALALLKETWPKAEWHLKQALEIFMKNRQKQHAQ